MSNSLVISSGSLFMVSGSLTPISGSISSNQLTGSAIKSNFTLDSSDNSSFIISGSNPSSSIYLSSSGKFGFGTTDPLVDFDIRSNEFQIQKTGKRQGVKVNEEGNLESFNSETDAAATGSEFILKYTRGGSSKVTTANLRSIFGASSDEITKAGGASAFFASLDTRDQDKILFLLEREGGNIDQANVGDVLGSIRWVATSGSTTSLNERTAGEAATIQAVVNTANKFGTSADLIFKVADKAALEGASSDLGAAAAPKTALILDGNYQHELTGSLTSTGNIIAPNITANSSSFSTRITANEAASGSFSTRVTANDAKITSQFPTPTTSIKGSTVAIGKVVHTAAESDDARDTLSIILNITDSKGIVTTKTFNLTSS